MKTHTLYLSFALAFGLFTTAVQAQHIYLDATMEPCAKAKATYYLEADGYDGAGGYLASIHMLDGTLKAKGRYLDEGYRVPDGHFVFYHPNGTLESQGLYEDGYKSGVWIRKDRWGRELAEKVYDPSVLKNIVYTLAQTMPEYPEGEKAMVRYLKRTAGASKGVMASFIVEKDGSLSDLNVIGAQSEAQAHDVAEVITGAGPWSIGEQDGRPVRVRMQVAVK